MLLSLRKNGLTSLFKEVRVFKAVSSSLRDVAAFAGTLSLGLGHEPRVLRC